MNRVLNWTLAAAAAVALSGCAGVNLPTAVPTFGGALCQKYCSSLQSITTAGDCDAATGACLTYLKDAEAVFTKLKADLPASEPADGVRLGTLNSALSSIGQFKPNCSSPKATDNLNTTQCKIGTTAVRTAAGTLFANLQVGG